MKKLIPIVLLICSCYSCATDKKEENISRIDLKSFEETTLKFKDKTFFQNCFLVKLEASEKSMLGRINQVEVFKEYIYIHDGQTSRILIFDKSGKYLSDVGSKGRGPEEYVSASIFFINPYDKSVNVIDPLNSNVIKYSLTGKFINKIKYENSNMSFVNKITMINENELFCYSTINWRDDAAFSVLNATDLSLKETILSYPYRSEKQMNTNLYPTPFSFNDGKVIFITPFSNQLLSYKNGETEPYIYVDNDKEEISSELLSTKLKANDDDFTSVMSQVADEGKYNTGISTIYENSRFLYCEYRVERHQAAMILWDKKEKKGFFIKPATGLNFHGMATVYENTAVCVLHELTIASYQDRISKDENAKALYPKELLDVLNSYNKEVDNPILVFYEFNS